VWEKKPDPLPLLLYRRKRSKKGEEKKNKIEPQALISK